MSKLKLPDTRQSVTHRAVIYGKDGKVKFFFTLGFYEDGKPGELFLHMDQSGSTLDGFADAWSTAFSMCLQLGAPMKSLIKKFGHQDFEPRGMTDNPDLRMAQSVIDYVVRWIETYCHLGKETNEQQTKGK